MKRNTGMLIILLMINFCAGAQLTESIRVNAGDDITSSVSVYGIYRFPAFANGNIFLKDGTTGAALLNYNILSDQILLIDEKGDTVALTVPEKVKKITINRTNFYFDKKECLEEIANVSATSLVLKRKITVDYEKKGAMGIPSASGGGINSYSTFLFNGSSYHLTINEDAVIKKQLSYFLLTDDGRLLPATRSNFNRVFSKNKEKTEAWLNANKIDFSKEKDLVQILNIAGADN